MAKSKDDESVLTLWLDYERFKKHGSDNTIELLGFSPSETKRLFDDLREKLMKLDKSQNMIEVFHGWRFNSLAEALLLFSMYHHMHDQGHAAARVQEAKVEVIMVDEGDALKLPKHVRDAIKATAAKIAMEEAGGTKYVSSTTRGEA